MKNATKSKRVVLGALAITAVLCISALSALGVSETSDQTWKAHTVKAVHTPLTPQALGGQDNILISVDNPDGDDMHPKVAIKPGGAIVVVYEKQIGMFSRTIPMVYSANGQSWTLGFEFDSADFDGSGLLSRPDISYNSQLDQFAYSVVDPIGDQYNLELYWIPGDIAGAQEIQGVGTSGVGATDHYGVSVMNVAEYMVTPYICDEPDYDLYRCPGLGYWGYPDFAHPPDGMGGFYYDGGSVTPTTPASNIECVNGGGQHMYMVMQTGEGDDAKIAFKATVTDMDQLNTAGGGPGGMDKYADIEVWPWQGFLVDAAEMTNVQVADPDVGASGNNVAIVYADTDNSYGDWDIKCAYTSTIPGEGSQYTWETSVVADNHPADETNPAVFVSGNNVFVAYVSDGNLYLVKSEDGGATWGEPEQINTEDGTVVAEERTVDIGAGGIVWTDNRNGAKDIYYAPLPTAVINVDTISGGFGVSATVTNTGTEDASAIDWTISLSGPVFVGKEASGTIDSLPAGGETTIGTGLVFGIGPTTITVTASGATKTASGLVLGPLVLGL